MSLSRTPKLKFKYNLFSLFFVLGCIAVSSYPIWIIAQWLAESLGIPDSVPVKEQENGWLWVFLFLLEAILLFVATYAALGLFFCKAVGWSKETYFNMFWKGKYPNHWHK